MRIHFPLFLKRFWFGNVQSRRGSHSFHPAHQFMKLKQRLHSVLVPSAEVLIKGRQIVEMIIRGRVFVAHTTIM
jgi:hypothetical protein